jgi:hypothetical protein
MIDELAILLPYFRGSTNRVRCFLHIINLVARKILTQFDLPKKKPGHLETDLDQLAGDIDEEELETRKELEGGEDDDNDGVSSIPDDASEEVHMHIQCVRKVLVKVNP